MKRKIKKCDSLNACNKQKTEKSSIETDPFGSYTGVCVDKWDTPVQDADDL